MKKRSALLLSTLFVAGCFAVNNGVAHADTVDNNSAVQTTTQNTNVAQDNSQSATTNTSATNTNVNANSSSNTNAAGTTTNTQTTDTTPQTQTVSVNQPQVQDKFVGQINYVKGYGVNLWKLNQDQSLTWIAPRRLAHGSKWQVYGYTDLADKKMRLYNLGGNQWVDSQYLVNTSVPAKSAEKTDWQKDATALPANSFIVIGYTPGYGTAVWRQEGNQMRTTGKTLYNGTAWKAFSQKTLNNILYYNVGGNQWVNSNYAIVGAATAKYTSLKNDPLSREYYTTQYNPVFAPWGCASAALSMLMKYDGSWDKVPGADEAAKLKYMQDNLPRNKAQGGQDGNPYNGKGFTRVILSYALKNYAHSLGDNKVKDISGASLNTIARLVEAGHPVLYYGWSSYNGNGKGTAGQEWARNHCKVIFGYNPSNNTFLVHDPLYMNKHFRKGGSGEREGIYNGYDLGPIAWVSYSSLAKEYAYRGGSNALTVQ